MCYKYLATCGSVKFYIVVRYYLIVGALLFFVSKWSRSGL